MHVNYTDCTDYTIASVATEDDAGIVIGSGLYCYLSANVELHDAHPVQLTARLFSRGELIGYIELVDTSFARLDKIAYEVLPFAVYCEANRMIGLVESEWYKFLI